MQRCLSLHHFRDRLDEAVSEIETRMLLWVFKLQVSFKSYIQFPRRLRMTLMRNEYISAPWKEKASEKRVCALNCKFFFLSFRLIPRHIARRVSIFIEWFLVSNKRSSWLKSSWATGKELAGKKDNGEWVVSDIFLFLSPRRAVLFSFEILLHFTANPKDLFVL